MTELDPETRARIQAEEQYRATLRGPQLPIGGWLGGLAGLVLALGPFTPAFELPGMPTATFMFGETPTGYLLVGLGVLTFVLALFPKVRHLNMFTGFAVFATLFWGVVTAGFSTFMSLGPQYGWAIMVFGAVIAITAGYLSTTD